MRFVVFCSVTRVMAVKLHPWKWLASSLMLAEPDATDEKAIKKIALPFLIVFCVSQPCGVFPLSDFTSRWQVQVLLVISRPYAKMSSTTSSSASATPLDCAYGYCGNQCLETSNSICCTGGDSGNSSGTVQCGNGWSCSQTSG